MATPSLPGKETESYPEALSTAAEESIATQTASRDAPDLSTSPASDLAATSPALSGISHGAGAGAALFPSISSWQYGGLGALKEAHLPPAHGFPNAVAEVFFNQAAKNLKIIIQRLKLDKRSNYPQLWQETKALIEAHKQYINARDSSGCTLLMHAMLEEMASYDPRGNKKNRSLDNQERLLDEKIKEKTTDTLSIALFLIENGADPSLPNQAQKTALSYCCEHWIAVNAHLRSHQKTIKEALETYPPEKKELIRRTGYQFKAERELTLYIQQISDLYDVLVHFLSKTLTLPADGISRTWVRFDDGRHALFPIADLPDPTTFVPLDVKNISIPSSHRAYPFRLKALTYLSPNLSCIMTPLAPGASVSERTVTLRLFLSNEEYEMLVSESIKMDTIQVQRHAISGPQALSIKWSSLYASLNRTDPLSAEDKSILSGLRILNESRERIAIDDAAMEAESLAAIKALETGPSLRRPSEALAQAVPRLEACPSSSPPKTLHPFFDATHAFSGPDPSDPEDTGQSSSLAADLPPTNTLS